MRFRPIYAKFTTEYIIAQPIGLVNESAEKKRHSRYLSGHAAFCDPFEMIVQPFDGRPLRERSENALFLPEDDLRIPGAAFRAAGSAADLRVPEAVFPWGTFFFPDAALPASVLEPFEAPAFEGFLPFCLPESA